MIASHGLRVDRRTFLKLAGCAGGVAVGVSVMPSFVGASRAGAQTAVSDSEIHRLASTLDYDVERIFRFVADEIRYEPYVGVLRGAAGTLSGRAGNSADQALLLGALLDVSQLQYRFAIGTLDQAAAEAVMAGTVRDRAAAARDVMDAWAGTAARSGQPATQPDPEVERIRAAAEANGPNVVAWAQDRFAESVDTIETALGAEGIRLPGSFATMPDRERREHTWVQVVWGPDWLDLDPTLPGSIQGQTLTTAAAVAAALPEELHHRVRFSVIAEHVAAGSLETEPLLMVEAPAAAISGKPVLFLNALPDGLKGTGIQIATSIEGRTAYLPALSVGDEAHVASQAILLGTGPGILDAGGSREGETTAEWLEMTILAPDAPPVTVRRDVFDRVGPAARASGAVDVDALPNAELVTLPEGGGDHFLPAQSIYWLTVNTGMLGGDTLQRAFQPPDQLGQLAAVVHGYHAIREATALEVALPAGVRLFADAPNVVGMIAETRLARDGEVSIELSLDVLHRSHGQLGVTGVAPGAPPALSGGVISHLAERVLLGDGPAPEPGSDVPASVGAIFDAVFRGDVGYRTVSRPEQARDLPYPLDVVARLESSVASGLVAVAPERPVVIGGRERTGWWLIDPATGRCTDQLDDGRGGMEGYSLNTTRAAEAQPRYAKLGSCVAFGALFVAFAVLNKFIIDQTVPALPGVILGVPTSAGLGVLAKRCLGL